MVKLYLVAVLCACSSIAASETFTVVVPGAPVVTPLGHTAHLPCWLTPAKDSEGMEVRWYRGDQFDSPTLFYRERKLVPGSQKGRASFGLRDAKSDGLRAGDVSLKLVNTTLEDAGMYTCYVSSDQGFDKANVNLNVTAMGTSPLLSVMWKGDGPVNVSCESEGWYPKPTLQWSNQDQTLDAKGIVHRIDTSGLVSVHSWILLSTPFRVTCSVALSKEEERQGIMNLQMQPGTGDLTPECLGWKVVFILILLALLVSMAILAVKHFKSNREKRRSYDVENGTAQGHTAQPLKPQGSPGGKSATSELEPETAAAPDGAQKVLIYTPYLNIDKVTTHQVNVTLDKTVNEYLKMKDGVIVRDAEHVPGEEVTLLTSIHGTPGFSSGQQGYWEVCLGDEKTGIKKSWWIGVANVSVASGKPMLDNVPLQSIPSSSDGFLFLSSKGDEISVNTQPATVLTVTPRPEILGVYLNYDMGELAFYDVKSQTHIVTLVTHFTEEVVPFFNPGKGDIATLTIVHKNKTEGTGSEDEPLLTLSQGILSE